MNAVVVPATPSARPYYGKVPARAHRSAVVADLVDVTRLHTADPDHRVPHLAFRPPDGWTMFTILPMEAVAFLPTLRVADRSGVLARITGILAEHGISIDAVLQREERREEPGPTSSS